MINKRIELKSFLLAIILFQLFHFTKFTATTKLLERKKTFRLQQEQIDGVSFLKSATFDCTYPSGEGFENALTPEQLQYILAEDEGFFFYNGKSSHHATVAAEIHRHISCASQQHSTLRKFCNTGRKVGEFNMDAIEAAAFLAHVKQETSNFRVFEELSSDRACTQDPEFPCSEKDVSYHARGPLKVRGNREYGKLSLFLFNDAKKLLQEPELIEPSNVSGWTAALWKWMAPRLYGTNCPETAIGSSEMSCHDAITDLATKAPSSTNYDYAGFGLTVNILRGDSECCPNAAIDMVKNGQNSDYRLPKSSTSNSTSSLDQAKLFDYMMSYNEISAFAAEIQKAPSEVVGSSNNNTANETNFSSQATTDVVKRGATPALEGTPSTAERSGSSLYSTYQFQNRGEIRYDPVDAAYRIGNFVAMLQRLRVLPFRSVKFLPGGDNCLNSTADPSGLCASITRGCEVLHSTGTNGCHLKCKPLPINVFTPQNGTVASVKFDGCGYSCSL